MNSKHVQNLQELVRKLNIAISLSVVVALAGCASADITSSQPYTGPQLPKPSRILVYDFTANLNEIPASSPLRSQLVNSSVPTSAEQMEISRQLGASISSNLVSEIQGMGLYAMRAQQRTVPRTGDIVLKGFFLSVQEGSATERMALGFGTGAAQLTTRVEGYQMTDQGLRFLGSGESTAGSGKTPGAAVGVAVAVATANPIGLLVSSAAKAAGEATGSETIEGAGSRTAKLIANRLQTAFQNQGWI